MCGKLLGEMLLPRIDHVTLIVRTIDAAVDRFTALLGRGPTWRGRDPELGTAGAIFGLGHTMLELVAPDAEDERTAGMREWIATYGEGPQALAFGADDLDALRPVLREHGVPTTQPEAGEVLGGDGATRRYRTLSLSPVATRGVQILVVERDDFETLCALPAPAPGEVQALDHVVLRTQRPDAAVALYGDSLGLRLALDRELFGVRMLFFRVGGVTLEVVEDHEDDHPDRLWGIALRVGDIHAAHERLLAAGFALSPIRDGNKPGTHTFTVKEGVHGVPTLIIRDPARD